MPEFLISISAERNEKGESRTYGKQFYRNFGDQDKATEWGKKQAMIRYPTSQHWAKQFAWASSKEDAVLNARKADAGEMSAFPSLDTSLPVIPVAAAKTSSVPDPVDHDAQTALQLSTSVTETDPAQLAEQVSVVMREWLKGVNPDLVGKPEGDGSGTHITLDHRKKMLHAMFMQDSSAQQQCQDICKSKIDIENFATKALDSFYADRAKATH